MEPSCCTPEPGKMPRIDVHTHILPPSWPSLKEKYGYGGWVRLEHCSSCKAKMYVDDKFFREVESNCYDPVVRLSECKEKNVDIQVLSTVPVMFSYWAKPADALDLSMYLNDHIAQVCTENPGRFLGLGTIPLQAPELAVKELRRCVQDLGLCGVQIGSHVNTWTLDAPELFPVFEAAAELGACVFIHPWQMIGSDLMKKYWLPWLVGMPAETCLAICSMIFGGIFERLPNLRVCFAHGGGSFPFTLGRIAHGFEARPDLCAVDNDKNPRDYCGKFWVDSLVHDSMAFEYLTKIMGEDKIVMGTDYPFPLGEMETPGKIIDTADFLSEEKKSRMFFDNACNWLGVDKDKLFEQWKQSSVPKPKSQEELEEEEAASIAAEDS